MGRDFRGRIPFFDNAAAEAATRNVQDFRLRLRGDRSRDTGAGR